MSRPLLTVVLLLEKEEVRLNIRERGIIAEWNLWFSINDQTFIVTEV